MLVQEGTIVQVRLQLMLISSDIQRSHSHCVTVEVSL